MDALLAWCERENAEFDASLLGRVTHAWWMPVAISAVCFSAGVGFAWAHNREGTVMFMGVGFMALLLTLMDGDMRRRGEES